jgi:hypothetical protein
LSLYKRFHPQQCSQTPEYASAYLQARAAFGRICFALSRPRRSNVTTASDTPVSITNLKRCFGNAEDSLGDWIQLNGFNVLLSVLMGGLTSANTAPTLMTVSTRPSTDLLISGEYDFNDSSSF